MAKSNQLMDQVSIKLWHLKKIGCNWFNIGVSYYVRKDSTFYFWLIGIIGENMSGCKLYEVVKIGSKELLGEIMNINDDTATIFCFDNVCKCFYL